MINPEDIYPITKITYPDGRTMEVITDEHLKQYTPPIQLNELLNSLRGNTRIMEGNYVNDIYYAINNLRNPD